MSAWEKSAYDDLSRLHTEELEALLREDKKMPDAHNTELILRVLEELDRRERDHETEQDRGEDTARLLRDFHEIYHTAEGNGRCLYSSGGNSAEGGREEPMRRKPLSLRRMVLAAAVVCLSSLLVCTAIGFERVFQMVGKWTSEILTFENQYKGEEPDGAESPQALPQDGEYATFEEALAAYGITTPVVPAYIPEVFTESGGSVSATALGENVTFYTFYENGDERLMIQITAYDTPGASYFEKDDTEVVEYLRGGITHYVYSNIDFNCAVWYNGNLECLIGTTLPRSEVFTMVDSIYE